MAKNGDFGLMNADEGEQDTTHFILLPPHQNAFFTELSSQFSNIDKKFEHLFECLNQKNITEKQPNSASNLSSELNVLYLEILSKSQLSTVSGDLRDLGYCVDPPKVSFCQSHPF